jgi:hypothetical protein
MEIEKVAWCQFSYSRRDCYLSTSFAMGFSYNQMCDVDLNLIACEVCMYLIAASVS